MTIARIETIVVGMPMSIKGDAPLMGGRPRTRVEALYVRVETDAGSAGWGGSFGHRRVAGAGARRGS